MTGTSGLRTRSSINGAPQESQNLASGLTNSEHLEQVIVGNRGRVVLDLDRFGVSGAVGANIVVGGIGEIAARVADTGGNHAGI